jgi:hypothetical protein
MSLVIWLWPRDAVPSFKAPPPTPTGEMAPYPVYADSGTAKFFRLVMPVYYAVFFALSPLGYVLWNIRRIANELHRLRTRLTAWLTSGARARSPRRTPKRTTRDRPPS